MIIKMVINNEMKEYTEEEAKKLLYKMGYNNKKNNMPKTRKQIFKHIFPPANRKMTKEEEAMNKVFYEGYLNGYIKRYKENNKKHDSL